MVIGSCGFIGKHFTNYIKIVYPGEFIVYELDKFQDRQTPLNKNEYFCDLANIADIIQILNKLMPDYIINLTGLYGGNTLTEHILSNVVISSNILDSVLKLKIPIKKILLIGSAAEYGNNKTSPFNETSILDPITYYGFSKFLQTKLMEYFVNVFDLPVCLARTFNVIGKGISTKLSIGAFISKIKNIENKGELIVGNIGSYRDFVDVEDVCNAFMKILVSGQSGSVYNVCSGKAYQIKEVLEMLIRISGKDIKIISQTGEGIKSDVALSFGDFSRLENELDWHPKVTIIESLMKAYK
jgi:GDP-4-dehydro-6-deoxy-D-mannose reductase